MNTPFFNAPASVNLPAQTRNMGKQAPKAGINTPTRPDIGGSVLTVLGFVLTYFTLPDTDSTRMMHYAAVGALISLCAGFLLDMRLGFRNLVRADAIMLISLYGLTFAEFLFTQETLLLSADSVYIAQSIGLMLLAMGVIVIARHATANQLPATTSVFRKPVSPYVLLTLFWFCVIVGYLHQWIAVSFNLKTWLVAMTGPRFSQPWGRGMFGDWTALLYELGALIFIIIPLGAILLVRYKKYSFLQLTGVVITVAITFFYFYTEGTRHKFIAQIVLFIVPICYLIRLTPLLLVLYTSSALLVAYGASKSMLTFRQIGFSEYWRMKMDGVKFQQESGDALFVDNNILSVSRLLQHFPERSEFVGLDMIYFALVRPIPRAIWADKPVGVVEPMIEALQEEGASLSYSMTFVGEAWMCYGYIATIGMSWFFGWLAGYWNRYGTLASSDFGLLIYASGFLSLVIAMRSYLVFTTLILPTIFLIVAAYYLGDRLPKIIHKQKARKTALPAGFDQTVKA